MLCFTLDVCFYISLLIRIIFSEEGPDLRAVHIQQHDDEAEKLDSIIDVLETINKNLEAHE